jgi:hypothetical protein
MSAAKLTPVERGALFVLMAEGRPLSESSELRGVHGIDVKSSHRAKLKKLGLIDTTKDPYYTHSLSKKGLQWAREQMAAPSPKGQIGAGALYAVLHGLQRHIEEHGYSLEYIFDKTTPKRPDRSQRHMHEAAWSEADEALGQALQDMPVFTKAIEALQQASSASIDGLVKRTSAAAKLVLQSVRHAGRKRELALAMDTGAETAFDPAMHHSDDAPEPGDRVRIRKPPVIRGPANARVVILMGEVESI